MEKWKDEIEPKMFDETNIKGTTYLLFEIRDRILFGRLHHIMCKLHYTHEVFIKLSFEKK